MSFNIIGDIFGSTGYASHTRNLANALSNIADVRLTTQLPPNWNMQVTDRELDMIKKQPKKDEINIIITNPMYWRLNLGVGRNWAYLVWEGDRIPKGFMEECLNEDIEYILVPSEHTKTAILNTFKDSLILCEILDKIKIIPHGVNLSLFYPKEKPSKCVFMCNKGLRGPEDRGGIQYLIRAFIEEFTDEDTELIIKINPAYGLVDMNKVISEIAKDKKFPKISINDQQMKYEDLVKLYNRASVFVSPTRSEAFNIPCIEAMACGLPVITTNFGGQTDYVNEENGWIIGGEMTEVKWDLMYEGISWLTPDITQLRKILREAYNGKVLREEKANKALETAREYTWDNSADLINQLV